MVWERWFAVPIALIPGANGDGFCTDLSPWELRWSWTYAGGPERFPLLRARMSRSGDSTMPALPGLSDQVPRPVFFSCILWYNIFRHGEMGSQDTRGPYRNR
jgi:hypothetical protein